MLTRRMVFAGAAGLMAAPSRAENSPFARIEADGRLGVAVLDTGTGRTLRYRAEERFAMCSTCKLLLAAAILKRIETGAERNDRILAYSKDDHVIWSPVTERHIGEGLRIDALVAAILQFSDNTAANLLLGTIGGPKGWTDFARSLGDNISRLDRTEPTLNSAVPGDERDTTTPTAMLKNLQRILLGEVLMPASRQHLIDTRATSTTGIKRLRAGLPPSWRIADKTGTGEHGTFNDIAILYPPGRAPVLATAYYTQATRPDADSVLAEVGRIIAKEIAG